MDSLPQPSDVLATLASRGERLFDHLPETLFFVKDLDGRFVDGNAALATTLGAGSLDEVIGVARGGGLR